MKIIKYLFILAVLVSYGFQCGEDCDDYIYDTSSLQYQISPQSAQFSVGDTIRIQLMNEAELLLDESMEMLDISGLELIQYFNLFEVNENNAPINSGTNNIEIIHDANRLSFVENSNEITRYLGRTCENNDCSIELQLVVNEAGYYGIELLFGLISTNSDCEEYELKNNTFDANDNNFEILSEINTTSINFNPSISFIVNVNEESGFYFKVD